MSSGAYLSSTNPTGVNVDVVVANIGSAAAHDVIVTLRVPPTAPHTSAPQFPDFDGWTKSGPVAGFNGGWSQTYLKPLMAVGTETLSGTITFTDANVEPFERWGGHEFLLEGTIHTGGGATVGLFTPGTVAHTDPSSLRTTNLVIDRFQEPAPGPNIGRNRRYFSAGVVEVDGWSATGPLTATVTMTKNDAGRWSPKPFIELLHSEWEQANEGDEDTGSTWTFVFTTKAGGFSPQGGRNGTTAGNNSPSAETLFTSPWVPNPQANQFSVRFRPHAGPLTGSGAPARANDFVGTLTFSTTSAGQSVSTTPYSREFVNSYD